jgi:hypothetical protein
MRASTPAMTAFTSLTSSTSGNLTAAVLVINDGPSRAPATRPTRSRLRSPRRCLPACR